MTIPNSTHNSPSHTKSIILDSRDNILNSMEIPRVSAKTTKTVSNCSTMIRQQKLSRSTEDLACSPINQGSASTSICTNATASTTAVTSVNPANCNNPGNFSKANSCISTVTSNVAASSKPAQRPKPTFIISFLIRLTDGFFMLSL